MLHQSGSSVLLLGVSLWICSHQHTLASLSSGPQVSISQWSSSSQSLPFPSTTTAQPDLNNSIANNNNNNNIENNIIPSHLYESSANQHHQTPASMSNQLLGQHQYPVNRNNNQHNLNHHNQGQQALSVHQQGDNSFHESNELPGATLPSLFIPTKRQHELIKSHPGSLGAVARALKMAIAECQYQMRNEPWDCPIYGFSIKPAEIFGTLMSRSFKETSFIQSLISSAIAHSVTRACTDSHISTCGRKQAAHGNGFSEDIEFGRKFAKRFMELSHDWQPAAGSAPSPSSLFNDLQHQPYYKPSSLSSSNQLNIEQQNLIQSAVVSAGPSGAALGPHSSEPVWKEKRLRHMINAHNDEVGLLQVLNGMRRECKCHGLSGACTLHTCWLRLPPFREVANQLHASLDKALRIEMYASKSRGYLSNLNRHKSLTSSTATTTKKSNKKRSSSSPQTAIALNGLGRASTSKSSGGDFAGGSGGRLQAFHDSTINKIEGASGGVSKSALDPNNSTTINDTSNNSNNNNLNGGIDGQSSREFASISNINGANSSIEHQMSLAVPGGSTGGYTSAVKKRPIARSIGINRSIVRPDKSDLLYAEESPDFCVPSEHYNIKGTKGRLCSENPKASNSCERLCCGRGFRTEKREEKYKCECKFEFCCKLECKTCTRKKVLYKCL